MYGILNEEIFYEHLQNTPTIKLPYPVKDFMQSWSLHEGYPVLNVLRNADASITVSQERFRLDVAIDDPHIWYIPFQVVSLNATNSTYTTPWQWLISKSSTLTELDLLPESWIILNHNRQGFYRVNYDETNWDLLITTLTSSPTIPSTIIPMNRAQLIDDAFNFARGKKMSYGKLFDLLNYVQYETEYVPLQAFTTGLTYIGDMLVGTDINRNFKAWSRNMLRKAYESLGTALNPSDSHQDIFNRNLILKWMCRLGDVQCLFAMKTELNAHGDIDPDLQEPVYCGGMHSGAEAEWYYLNSLYNSDGIGPYQKERVIKGMACIVNSDYLVK